MINISIPNPSVSITERQQIRIKDEPIITPINGFIDFHKIPRDQGGIFMFFNINDDLLFVGKARKLRQRIKKHFEDNVSPIKDHRDEVYRIDVCIVEDPMEREIYETYIANTLRAKYNVEKIFYK
ncbi:MULTISPECIES: nucleotide excision repair endonuclease [unclassified Sutcliffiella]|uniref:nucleotide excision repair endonuclease n=1 Tax=unclassified Sutcliffiella TaxID=2837532 RepID=UPI0030D1B750